MAEVSVYSYNPTVCEVSPQMCKSSTATSGAIAMYVSQANVFTMFLCVFLCVHELSNLTNIHHGLISGFSYQFYS